MSFDEENNDNVEAGNGGGDDKPKTFFGLELGDGVVYGIVVVLTLIFIRQVVVLIQALG